MLIKIVSVGPTEIKQGPKTSYSVFELTYKYGDQTRNKKIMSFQKEVFSVLSNCQPGQYYTVTQEKQGEFWNWISIATAAAPAEEAPSPGTARAPTKAVAESTYQSNKDASIARAVALKAAVDFATGETTEVNDILVIAHQFEGYLLNGAPLGYIINKPDIPEQDPNFK